jgi:hypothetical protein
MRTILVPFILGTAALLTSGCSSSAALSSQADGGGGKATNPDGVAYPSPAAGYGRSARNGTTPGSVMANFKFQGYLNGDSSKGLTTISLADYYDPCNKRYKLIHLTVGAVWCQPCFQETDALVAAEASLSAEHVVVLQALDDGPVAGTPATQSDLDYWIKSHKSNFTEMLDPGLQNLSGFFNASSVPWNADLDPRTMEILDASEGWTGSVTAEISLSVVPAAPSYALPVTCP